MIKGSIQQEDTTNLFVNLFATKNLASKYIRQKFERTKKTYR